MIEYFKVPINNPETIKSINVYIDAMNRAYKQTMGLHFLLTIIASGMIFFYMNWWLAVLFIFISLGYYQWKILSKCHASIKDLASNFPNTSK